MGILAAVSAYFSAMQPHEIVAWVFGILGILLSLILYAGRTRTHILICKLISDVLWFVNYILLGAYTGALLNVIAIGRETVFYNRDRRKWASHRIWLYVFILLTFLSPIMEFVKLGGFSWIPILPAIGSVLAVISFYSKRPWVMRCFGFGAQAFWITYGILIWNPTAVISSALIITSAVIGTVRELLARRAARKCAESTQGKNE